MGFQSDGFFVAIYIYEILFILPKMVLSTVVNKCVLKKLKQNVSSKTNSLLSTEGKDSGGPAVCTSGMTSLPVERSRFSNQNRWTSGITLLTFEKSQVFEPEVTYVQCEITDRPNMRYSGIFL